MKKRINESQLRAIISKSVRGVLREAFDMEGMEEYPIEFFLQGVDRHIRKTKNGNLSVVKDGEIYLVFYKVYEGNIHRIYINNNSNCVGYVSDDVFKRLNAMIDNNEIDKANDKPRVIKVGSNFKESFLETYNKVKGLSRGQNTITYTDKVRYRGSLISMERYVVHKNRSMVETADGNVMEVHLVDMEYIDYDDWRGNEKQANMSYVTEEGWQRLVALCNQKSAL